MGVIVSNRRITDEGNWPKLVSCGFLPRLEYWYYIVNNRVSIITISSNNHHHTIIKAIVSLTSYSTFFRKLSLCRTNSCMDPMQFLSQKYQDISNIKQWKIFFLVYMIMQILDIMWTRYWILYIKWSRYVFCQFNNSSWLNARSGRGSNLCNSINNFVTSFNHNLFINSLLKEKREFLGENHAFKTEMVWLVMVFLKDPRMDNVHWICRTAGKKKNCW